MQEVTNLDTSTNAACRKRLDLVEHLYLDSTLTKMQTDVFHMAGEDVIPMETILKVCNAVRKTAEVIFELF